MHDSVTSPSGKEGDTVKKYNYSKLLGRIREYGLTQAELATKIGVNRCTLSAKLNNQYNFSADEMDAICAVLDIPNDEIGKYFFAV